MVSGEFFERGKFKEVNNEYVEMIKYLCIQSFRFQNYTIRLKAIHYCLIVLCRETDNLTFVKP